MSAVVSVSVTKITISIETMAATWKVGIPKAKGVGTATTGPSRTAEKSATPRTAATRVPATMASRIDSREMVALPSFERTSTNTKVRAASPTFWADPNVSADGLPPMAHIAATGSSVSPMVVITTPVTTGGKNRMMVANRGAIANPISEATMTAPNTAGRPPPPSTIATMVATPANETPCTSGSWEPNHFTPMVCSRVARPPMNRHAVINAPISAGVSPAAGPMINGGAMMPPYMVSTCWRPYARVLPTGSFSSSGRLPKAVLEAVFWSVMATSLLSGGTAGVPSR